MRELISGYILLFLGTAVLCLGGYGSYQNYSFVSNSKLATARIINKKPYEEKSKNHRTNRLETRTLFVPVIEYEIAGVTYQTILKEGSSRESITIDDVVNIAYNEENPEEVKITNFNSIFTPLYFMSIFAFVLLGGGSLILKTRKNK